ncbi:hypothetical protein RBWH47_04265, partial [Rhodopirellula baltica WH47]
MFQSIGWGAMWNMAYEKMGTLRREHVDV